MVMLQNCNLLYLSLWDWVGVGEEVGGEEICQPNKPPARMPAIFHLKELTSVFIELLKNHNLKVVKIH
jgi:hypothetical protein